MIGVVGSGKTYVAEKLARRLRFLHIRTDELRVRQRAQSRRKIETNIMPLVKQPLREALGRGRSVILDADFIHPQRRWELNRIAENFDARMYYVYVWAPESLILTRLRKHRYTKNDLFQNYREAIRVYYMRRRWHRHLPRLSNLFVIKNNRPLEPQLSKIVKVIKGR